MPKAAMEHLKAILTNAKGCNGTLKSNIHQCQWLQWNTYKQYWPMPMAAMEHLEAIFTNTNGRNGTLKSNIHQCQWLQWNTYKQYWPMPKAAVNIAFKCSIKHHIARNEVLLLLYYISIYKFYSLSWYHWYLP